MKNSLLLAVLLSGFVPAAYAADATEGVAATQQAAIPSDGGDYKGDRITLRSDLKGIKSTDAAISTEFFAPDGATLDVVADNIKTDKLIIKFRSDTLDGSNACPDPSFLPCAFSSSKGAREKLPSNLVDGHSTYLIDKSAIENTLHQRRGWTFGALLVPFKYQWSDKSMSGSTTIGPYVGYKFQDNRGSITPVISIGLVNNVTVPLANGSGTVNRNGFSMATGIIFSIDKGATTQLGLLVGQDRLGSNAAAPYAYEGKTWLSVAIGWKFI